MVGGEGVLDDHEGGVAIHCIKEDLWKMMMALKMESELCAYVGRDDECGCEVVDGIAMEK